MLKLSKRSRKCLPGFLLQDHIVQVCISEVMKSSLSTLSSHHQSTQAIATDPDVRLLERLFNHLFRDTEQTCLQSGAEEPLYLPASDQCNMHVIHSTRDYFSSALHEISHWCIAGAARRKLVDFGYWYEPDGRTGEQQSLFEQVEVKPQALEWLFTVACGLPFRLSVDNVNQPEIQASEGFRRAVHAQALGYLEHGLPPRAARFLEALLAYFQPDSPVLERQLFQLEYLQ